MEKTIDGTKYEITPTPPSFSPYMTLLGKLLSVEPKDVEEAEKTSVEIDKAMTKLFQGTVSPKPKPEHYIQLYDAVIKETNKVLEETEFFRKSTKSDIEKSGSDEPVNPQASKRTVKP